MHVIVPLAGPDCYHPDYGIRPLIEVDNTTIIDHVLKSRPWWRSGAVSSTQLIFVLREHDQTPQLKSYLTSTFKGCRFSTISHVTRGAAHSALAGVPLLPNLACPLIIDLADISFQCAHDFSSEFDRDHAIQGLIPYFESTAPQYSYLKLNKQENVEKAAEKQVISTHATAGVYAFRSAHLFVDAVADLVQEAPDGHHNGLHFICPLYNSLIKKMQLIRGVKVSQPVPYAVQKEKLTLEAVPATSSG